MKLNGSKVSLTIIQDKQPNKKVKKFNSKGYFHQIQPYDRQYLKIKHQTFQKHRINQEKQNHVYNLLPSNMKIGFYEMKGYNLQKPKTLLKRRRVLKSLNQENSSQTIKVQQQKFSDLKTQKLASFLLNKYIRRKQRLKTRSERTLVSIYEQVRSNSQSVQSNSRSQHSFKASETQSRISNIENIRSLRMKPIVNVNVRQYFQPQRQNVTIIAAYRQKLKQRVKRLKTIQ